MRPPRSSNWTIAVGDTSVVVLDLLDAVYPGIMSIVLVLVMMSLIKKGKRPTHLILGIIALGMIGALIGIF